MVVILRSISEEFKVPDGMVGFSKFLFNNKPQKHQFCFVVGDIEYFDLTHFLSPFKLLEEEVNKSHVCSKSLDVRYRLRLVCLDILLILWTLVILRTYRFGNCCDVIASLVL